jgi:hypothetical protein
LAPRRPVSRASVPIMYDAATVTWACPSPQPIRLVSQPWGYEEIFALVPGKFCGKALHVHVGHALSLQYHDRKEEVIAVHSGREGTSNP